MYFAFVLAISDRITVKWETSNMLFLYPDRVDLTALGAGPADFSRSCPPWGIHGLDPRQHASAEAGRQNVLRCADAIGRKARAMLNSLPPDKRTAPWRILADDAWHWWAI